MLKSKLEIIINQKGFMVRLMINTLNTKVKVIKMHQPYYIFRPYLGNKIEHFRASGDF